MSDKKATIIGENGIIHREKMIATLFLVFISVAYLLCSPIGVDMDFHVLRIGELGKELGRIKSFSDFPVYIYRDVYYHYGYPIPIFYCALFLYPFALLVLLGMKALMAYKIMVLTLLWATFFICKACVCYWSKDKEFAFRAAFIYAAQPYFLMDLFVKASIGEAFAFLFVPVVTLGYLLVSRRGDQRRNFINGIIILALGVNGVICSHVISTIMVVGVLVIVFVIDLIKKNGGVKLVLGSALAAVLCFGLSLWYILPMLEQLAKYKYHAQLGATLSHAPENIFALLFPMHVSVALSAITGRSIPLSEVGGAPVIMILLVIFLHVKGWWKELTKKENVFLLIYLTLVILMSIGFVWIPFEKIFGFMQFTWRIYFIAALAGTAFIIQIIQWKKTSAIYTAAASITIVVGIYILFTCFGYFFVRDTLPRIIGKETTAREYQEETTDILYIPQSIDPNSLSTRQRIVTCDSKDVVFSYDINEDNGDVLINIMENESTSDAMFRIPFVVYQGYVALNVNNDTEYDVFPDDEGMASVIVPKDEVGSIRVRYVGTWIQRLSYYVSLAIIIMMLGGCFIRRKQSRHIYN